MKGGRKSKRIVSQQNYFKKYLQETIIKMGRKQYGSLKAEQEFAGLRQLSTLGRENQHSERHAAVKLNNLFGEPQVVWGEEGQCWVYELNLEMSLMC